MSALSEFLGSSTALQLVCMGISMMIGVLHLWMASEKWDANWWIAAWAGLSCVFLGARGVQLSTSDPEAALLAGKVAIAIGPVMVWAIVGFGRNLNGAQLTRSNTALLGGISFAWAMAITATPWFVDPSVSTRTDFFGVEHFAVHARWPTTLLSVYIAGALVWGIRRLRKHDNLEPAERRVLILGFGIYALLGICAVLTSMDVLPIPAMAEYGPFAVTLSLSYLLVRRRQRVEHQLGELLAVQGTRLAASEERYRDLVHHAPLGVMVCDENGELETVNPRMSQMLAASRSDAITEASPTLDPGLREAVESVRDQQTVFRTEHYVPDSSTRSESIWQITASPLNSAPGDGGVLVLADDITERKQLERQLQQAQKMDSVGQLAAGIAHEINTPMAYVRTNLRAMAESWAQISKQLKAKEVNPEPFSEMETLIEESMEGVERTISIVADMRELSHSADETRSTTDLAPILEGCVRIASVFDRRGAEVIASIPHDLHVHAAAGPLRQVFLNLLINALQAVGDRGRIWIDATRDAECVHINVRDDGPGIPASARSRLFDPFFTTKPVGEGTGLGLYISYQIIRSYGGDITVDESAEGGASFQVSLPIDQPDPVGSDL